MAYKVEARSVDRKGNPRAKFQFYGKTKGAAMANARKYFRKARNCEAGVLDDSGVFHPIEPESPRAAFAEEVTNKRRRNKSRRRRNKRRVRRTAAHGPVRRRKTNRRRKVNRKRVNRRPAARTNRRRKVNRRRRNKMPAALARYWRTHKRTGKKKNRRRR